MYFLYLNSPFLGVIQVLELGICPDLIRYKNTVEKAKVQKNHHWKISSFSLGLVMKGEDEKMVQF